MTENKVAVVNSSDEVIGAMSREEAKEKGLAVRIVGIILFRKNGNVVLHKIAANKAYCPMKWTVSAAGHVDAGESYELAAQRELCEELGVCGVPLNCLNSYDAFYHEGKFKGRVKIFFRTYKVVFDGKLSPDPKEIAEVREFSRAELIDLFQRDPDAFSGLVQKVIKDCIIH